MSSGGDDAGARQRFHGKLLAAVADEAQEPAPKAEGACVCGLPRHDGPVWSNPGLLRCQGYRPAQPDLDAAVRAATYWRARWRESFEQTLSTEDAFLGTAREAFAAGARREREACRALAAAEHADCDELCSKKGAAGAIADASARREKAESARHAFAHGPRESCDQCGRPFHAGVHAAQPGPDTALQDDIAERWITHPAPPMGGLIGRVYGAVREAFAAGARKEREACVAWIRDAEGDGVADILNSDREKEDV